MSFLTLLLLEDVISCHACFNIQETICARTEVKSDRRAEL